MDWKSRRVTTLLEAALLEDKAAQDVTTALTIDPALRATGTIYAKQPCIVAGIGCISAFLSLFNKLSARPGQQSARFEVVSHPEVFDGVRVKKGQPIAVIRANAASILSTERVILNLMQRMSGIATLTDEFVQAVTPKRKAKSKGKPHAPLTRILDTRKTIPGLRALDKYAVCCGGGLNHRLDLQDGILIKNNHISLGGGLPLVLAKALEGRKPGQIVQVEVRSPEELRQAIDGHADSILLDNMSPKDVKRAVTLIRANLPKAAIEASGNMNLKTVRTYAKTGVDFISVGALTHSATAVDLSMRIAATR
ncbi:MAG: carboxylating nicotinate-nucleotide diphosphorylase [Acidobacteriota bacterium]|nr:carboxylating nicotinate-nucleotide diphosphorylase [Acidobacteriota bacterium]